MKILSVFLISAGIALTSLGYQPPNNGHPAGTKESDCTYLS
ncbi:MULTISPECIES: hypothetical protein [Nostocales]|nr:MULTISPECIES: hypothetical protein [Nostocales]